MAAAFRARRHDTPQDITQHTAPWRTGCGGGRSDTTNGGDARCMRSQPARLALPTESSNIRIGAARAVFGFHDLIGYEILGVRLLAAIHYIFGEVETAGGWSASYGMMAGWRMRHLHRAELQETFSKRYSTE